MTPDVQEVPCIFACESSFHQGSLVSNDARLAPSLPRPPSKGHSPCDQIKLGQDLDLQMA